MGLHLSCTMVRMTCPPNCDKNGLNFLLWSVTKKSYIANAVLATSKTSFDHRFIMHNVEKEIVKRAVPNWSCRCYHPVDSLDK